MTEERGLAGIHSTLARTRAAINGASRRTDALAVFVLGTLGYLLLYLYTVGDLSTAASQGIRYQVVDDLGRALVSRGFFRFEPIALLSLARITYLFSPLNVLVGGLLAALVGTNLALTYLGLVQPRACGLESASGVFAGFPALLSGAACCGPTILLVLGVQATGVLITGFQLLVPVAALLLMGSLLLVGRQVDPDLL